MTRRVREMLALGSTIGAGGIGVASSYTGASMGAAYGATGVAHPQPELQVSQPVSQAVLFLDKQQLPNSLLSRPPLDPLSQQAVSQPAGSQQAVSQPQAGSQQTGASQQAGAS